MKSEAGSKRESRELSVAQKVSLIRDYGNGRDHRREHLLRYNVRLGTVSGIIHRKETIMTACEANVDCSYVRLVGFDRINKGVSRWFDAARARNCNITGPMLQEQAKKYA